MQRNNKFIIPAFIIAVVVTCAFSPALNNDFINLDDPGYVTENIYIRHASLSNIKALCTNFFVSTYNPIVNLTYLFEHHFFGLNPYFYHATNILLHTLNCLLVFWLLMLLDGSILVALLAALLFGLHPLRVESVAWVSERKDVLCYFFFLLALVDYCRYIKNGSVKYYYSSFFLFLLSLGSKAMAVTLPFVLFAIDYLLKRKINKKTLIEKGPFFVFALLFGLIAFFGQWKTLGFEYTSIANRMAVPFYGAVMYLYKTVFPVNLSALYPYPARDAGFYLTCSFYAVLTCLIVGAVIFSRRFTRKVIFAFLFAVITVFPVLIPCGAMIMADRFTYLPSIGILYAASVGFFYLYNTRGRHARILKIGQIIFLSGILAAFFILTYNRAKVWKDSITILSDVLKKQPGSDIASNNRGAAYAEQGNLTQAIVDYNRAIKINPNGSDIYFNRGNAYAAQGNLTQAIVDYNRAIKINPNKEKAYAKRGNAYTVQGNLAQAISDYARAIEINPKNTESYRDRGLIYYKQGDLGHAIADFTKIIELGSIYITDYYNRGNAYFQQGYLAQAISDYTKAVEISPGDPGNRNKMGNVYNNRSVSYYLIKEYDKALADFYKAKEAGYAADPDLLKKILLRGSSACGKI